MLVRKNSCDQEIRLAEQYLIKVLYPGWKCKLFDDLRVECYLHKNLSLLNLPTTLRSVESHILRCFCIIGQQKTLLAEHNHEIKASDHSRCREPGMKIKPKKRLLFIPEVYYVRCGCKSTCKGWCKCIKNDLYFWISIKSETFKTIGTFLGLLKYVLFLNSLSLRVPERVIHTY